MICDRCGRLLNRATGACNVCADHGGAAPPPVATTEAAAGPDGPDGLVRSPAAPAPTAPTVRGPSRDPGEAPRTDTFEPAGSARSDAPARRDPGEPPRQDTPPEPPREAPAGSVAATLRPASPYRLAPPMAAGSAPTSPGGAPPPQPPPDQVPAPVAPPAVPEAEQPISVSAAVAILDLSDKPEKPSKSLVPALSPTLPAEPAAPPRLPGAPWGVVRSGRMGRRKVDLVVYDGNLVIAKRGAPQNLTSGQLAAQDVSSRILAADAVEEALVREDAVSGQARIKMRVGDDVVVRWPGWKNRGVSAENLLTHAFPGKVDQGSPEIAKRTVRVMVTLGVSILLAVVAYLGLSALLEGDPPPPPPPAPTTTLPAPEQAARAALQQACPAWQQFAGTVAPGDRPNPVALRPVVDGMRPWFVAAADAGADPIYATARDEVGYLQAYAGRPVEEVARESVSRVSFAMRTVTSACDRATAAS